MSAQSTPPSFDARICKCHKNHSLQGCSKTVVLTHTPTLLKAAESRGAHRKPEGCSLCEERRDGLRPIKGYSVALLQKNGSAFGPKPRLTARLSRRSESRKLQHSLAASNAASEQRSLLQVWGRLGSRHPSAPTMARSLRPSVGPRQ